MWWQTECLFFRLKIRVFCHVNIGRSNLIKVILRLYIARYVHKWPFFYAFAQKRDHLCTKRAICGRAETHIKTTRLLKKFSHYFCIFESKNVLSFCLCLNNLTPVLVSFAVPLLIKHHKMLDVSYHVPLISLW